MSASVRSPPNPCSICLGVNLELLAVLAAIQTGGFVFLPPLSSSVCLPSTYFILCHCFHPFSSLSSICLCLVSHHKLFAPLSSISFPLNGPPDLSFFIPSSVISTMRIISCFSLLRHGLSYFSMRCLLLWQLSFLIGVSLCQLLSSACPPSSSHRPHLWLSSPTSPILYLREETGIRETANLPLRIGLLFLRVPRLFISSSCSGCHAVSVWLNKAVVAHKVKKLPYHAFSLQFSRRRC